MSVSHLYENMFTILNSTNQTGKLKLHRVGLREHIQQLNTKGPKIHFEFLQAFWEAKGQTQAITVLRPHYMHLNATAK